MQLLIVLAILVVVVFLIMAPLRGEPDEERVSTADGSKSHGQADPAWRFAEQLADLGAAREAKYREIRDTELDHATGKLSDQDFHVVDAKLRGEALEILNAIDRIAATESHAGRPEARETA